MSLFSEDFLKEEATYELKKIVETEKKLDRNDLIYKTGNKKRINHMIFKRLKQQDPLEEKFTTLTYP